MANKNSFAVVTQMLIRKPAHEVFNAFIDPEITKNFWFTKGSAKLEAGKSVKWEWEMYDVSDDVDVKEIIADKKIMIEWSQPRTKVEFEFEKISNNSTYVVITNSGFTKTGDDLLREVADLTGGFTTVLDGCKAYLEHEINLNLIGDKFAKGK